MSYKAFISYSHAADGKLAPALQSGLQQFAKPWYRLRELHIFRDTSSLAVSPALWPAIESALQDSEYLVLMASPESAASAWVGREIEWWLTNREIDHLLIVLTDGELAWDENAQGFDLAASSALPAPLSKAFAQEPLWLDLRWAKSADQVSMANPRFRDAVGDLASTLHGRSKDELVGEDVLQHRKSRRLARLAVSGLAALTVASVLGAWFAFDQRERAIAARDRGEGLIQYMLFELRDKLQPIGQLALLENVNERALEYYESFDDDAHTVDALRRQAAGLFNRGQVLLAQGELQGALDAYQDGIGRLGTAIEEAPERILLQENLAELTMAAGDILVRMGASGKALDHYQRAAQRVETTLQAQPENTRLLRDLGVSHERSGDVLIALGRLADAHAAYQQSIQISQQLAALDPDKPLVQADVAMANDKLGRVLLAQGQVDAAIEAYRRGADTFAKLAERHPDDMRWQAHVAMSDAHLADALADGGQLDAALAKVKRAVDGYERLAAHDPDNTAWRRDLASARNTFGSIAHRRGDWRAARAAYEAALNTARALAKNDPANREWQRDLAVALTKIGMLYGEQGAIGEARAAFEESVAVRERLAAHDPGNLRWQSDLADANAMLSDVLRRLGEAGPALERLRQALTLNEKLATAQPDNPAWQEALGDRKLALCSRLDMSGAPPGGARAACSKALSIAEALAAQSPSSDRKWHLARSHNGLAEHHFRHDELAEAQSNFEAARDILAALVESDAQNTQWQEDLATAQQGLSDVQFAQEDYFAGLKSFQVALRIRTKLAERDPENAAWQRALALAYERAADITLRATDNEKGALGLYRRSFKIYHEARQRSPNDLGNTLNLSITITKIGDLFWRRKEFDKALTAYRDAVRLREQVVAKHSDLPDWQHMLAESHVHLGQALFARQQVPAAIESFEAAQSLLAALFEHRQEDGRVLIDLARTTESIGSAKLHVGDTAAALAAYRTLAGHFAQLARRQPDEQNWIHGQAHAERLIADAHLADGNVEAAIEHFNAGLAVLESRVQSAPDPQSWLAAISAAAYHAGKSIAGASHDYANAVRDFLARARSPLQAIAANSALEEEQQKWLAEINALLINTPGADEAVHQDQASPADMPSAPVSAAAQAQ